MEQSIMFSPETDKRALQQEVDRIDREFSNVGTIEPDVQADTSGVGGAGGQAGGVGGVGGGGMATGGMAQVGGLGGGEGVGQQLGAIEAGVGGMGDKMDNRLPSSMPGRLSSKVLPVGLAGAASAGMLSQMTAASGHLQTSASVLEVARDNFFREPGRVLDEHVVRPLVNSLFDDSQAFDEMMREGNYSGAAEVAVTGNDPRESGLLKRSVGAAGSLAGAYGGAKAGAAGGAALGSVVPGAGTAGGALVGGAIGGTAGFFGGGRAASGLFEGAIDIGDKVKDGSLDLAKDAISGTIKIAEYIQGELKFGERIDGALDFQDKVTGDIGINDFATGEVDLVDYVVGDIIIDGFVDGSIQFAQWVDGKLGISDYVEGNIDLDEFVTGGEDGGGSGGLFSPKTPIGMQRGGVINSGPRTVTAGEAGPEIISPISEMRRMMEATAQKAANSGNGGGGMSDSQARDIKRGLDQLHSDLKKLQGAMNVDVSISQSEVARASAQGQSSVVTDTDPMA